MDSDVLIVGAGPAGLLLAGDLAEAGVSVTVLERRTTGSNLTRAFGVHARTLEQFDQRGIADELIATGLRLRRLRLFIPADLDFGRLPSRHRYMLITPQTRTEGVLRARAERLGVEFVLGAKVTGVRQDADGVDVTTADGERRRGRYLVGADGARSVVRRELGLPFDGRPVLKSIMLADVRLTEPAEDAIRVNSLGDAFAFVAPFGDGWYRVTAWDRRRQVPEDTPLDLDEVRDVTRRSLGTDLGMHDARWLSRFHCDERQAPHYRAGRVFLAGDAAHVHTPAGGQGMNTGLQDAANLSWKLAAVLSGRLPESLLDTYETERHPVGKRVLRSSGAMIRLAMGKQWPARDRMIAGALSVGPLGRRAAGVVSGIGIRYAPPRGADRRVGARAEDADLPEGRLYELLRGGRFVHIGRKRPAGLPEHVVFAHGEGEVLVRPDGYVARVGDPAGYFTGLTR
ncbi:FAD-dependent monooxygenase [Amycolatopsis sp. NBC_01480]|uniref:FAD-dependent monooxygenase n=1 Tax=Amycolatopsis sp. NBC_01480 TaxID=2903562 RepID=UPI002E2A12F8|nr:FAD-dependent monooxygenase [Amycolatopsis sp. NBC_01480]